MKRVLSVLAVAAGIGLATDSARAEYAAPPQSVVRIIQAPTYTPGTYYLSNGYYYYYPAGTAAGTMPYSIHNGVTRGPSGAMTGRASHSFDPTGRPVQLHKPWLQPLR